MVPDPHHAKNPFLQGPLTRRRRHASRISLKTRPLFRSARRFSLVPWLCPDIFVPPCLLVLSGRRPGSSVHRIRLLPCDSFLHSWRQSCLVLSEDFWLSLPSSCSAPGRTQMLPPRRSAGWALPASMWSRTQWDCLTMGKSVRD